VKDYANFSVNDFVLDECFAAWVTRPDEYSNAFWQQFLADNPAKANTINEAKSVIRHLAFSEYKLSENEVANIWKGIRSFEGDSGMPAKSTRFAFRSFYKAAAAILLMSSIIFLYRYFRNDNYLQYHTAYGETKTILLPDSSTVILNSNSTLKLPRAWDAQQVRTVWLEGEAFFSVIHLTSDHPFKVYTTDDVAVEVLGTTFNVYHRTEETKVVLNTGQIRLHLPEEAAANNITMKPGEFIEYKQKTFSRRTVNPAIYSAWTEKRLILDRTSLREIVEMMRDNYGVEITVGSDSLLNQTVSGTMPLADVDELVNQIASTFQLKIVKQKNGFLMFE
jgi:ferric-dicitrate binding protein FerR (iron transport regulator)